MEWFVSEFIYPSGRFPKRSPDPNTNPRIVSSTSSCSAGCLVLVAGALALALAQVLLRRIRPRLLRTQLLASRLSVRRAR